MHAKHQHTTKMTISIKLLMKVFCLLLIFKIQSTALEDTLPNAVEETSKESISTQKNHRLTNCENIKRLKFDQKCTFNNLFIQLIEPKGQGSFGQVWKVTFSRLPFEQQWRNQHVAAIKFIQCSKENIKLATAEMDILMKLYQDKVEHVTKIVPELTTNMTNIDSHATFGANKTNSTKWIMIGMQCYDMDLHSYASRKARTPNFKIHLLIANLMVCISVYLFAIIYYATGFVTLLIS